MSGNPGSGVGGSSSAPPLDYLGLLGGLSPLPFDPNTVISGLLAIDQIPITNLQTEIKNIQTNESIYKSLGADTAAFQAAAMNLTLQSTIQANTVTSSNTAIVNGTASPSAQAGSYSVLVNALASATAASSTAGIGQSIDSAASTTPLSALNLSGTPTAGTLSVVIDGKMSTINVDTTKPLIDPPGTNPPQGALSQLQAAITAGIADSGATVSVGVSGDKVNISISGASAAHSISFGASGDTSNLFSLLNLSTVSGSTTGGALTLSSSARVGVAQPAALLSAGALSTTLTGATDPVTDKAMGSFSVNGVSISWNAGTDSLNSVIQRINGSAAGVVAQYNSVTDQLILSNKQTGQTAISLTDTTGNFLTAMNLAPGTTTAQKLGTNASITVNGTTVTSTSNTFTNAAPGLSITASALTTGSPVTLTVGTDTTNIAKSVQSFVDAANKVLGDVNLTQQKDPVSGQYSQLLGDPFLTGLQDNILTMVTGSVTRSGPYQSLQDVGITTGAVGSLPGSTTSFSLDTSKLSAALAANPQAVAALFNGTTATTGFQGAAQQLNTYLNRQINPITGPFAEYQSTGDAQIQNLNNQITFLNQMIANQRQILTRQFSAMSTALSNLASQSAMFANMSSSSSSSSSGSSTGH